MFIALAFSTTGMSAPSVVSTLGPMMYLIPIEVSFSIFEADSCGSSLSSSATISMVYVLSPIFHPPAALIMAAVVSAEYLLTNPQEAA